jgi:DNA polymerase V
MDIIDGNLQQGVTEHTGFPNPATDTNIVPLDLTKLLIKHPLSTFFMRIDTNEWEQFGIFKEDLAIIDRSLKPKPIDLVIWWDESTFIISKFHKLPMDTMVWGTVTAIVHRYRS